MIYRFAHRIQALNSLLAVSIISAEIPRHLCADLPFVIIMAMPWEERRYAIEASNCSRFLE